MSDARTKPQRPLTIKDLYPHLTDEQLREAEENLDRYLEHALRVYERLRADPEAWARYKALTASDRAPTINEKESPASHSSSL